MRPPSVSTTRDADVGHCRLNLAARFGERVADRFTDLHGRASGRSEPYHPYWDVVAAMGGIGPSIDLRPDPRTEAFLARALVQL